MSERETVLVTGASGFIGSILVEMLARQGYHVLATDAQESSRTSRFTAIPGVEFLVLDLRHRDALAPAVAQADRIVHLAALRPAAASANPRTAFEVNVAAAYDLIELAAQHDVRRIVYGSSHSVYGAFAQPRVFRHREYEVAEGRGLAMYGASKLAVEAYLQAHANTGGSPYISLRLGTIYGPGVNRDNSLGGMMMDAVDAVRAGERAVVEWEPDAQHDLLFVTDAAASIVAALQVDTEETVINVVGEPVSTTQLFGELVTLAGGDISAIDWMGGKARYQMVSQDRMLAVLGPVPTSLREGLQAFLNWHLGSQTT